MPPRRASLAVAAAAGLAYAALTVVATTAAADGDAASDASSYRSTVTAVEPPAPGLRVEVTGGGESVTVENGTGQEVDVIGLAGEPYLRLTSTGVEVNTLSLTAHLAAGQTPSGPVTGPDTRSRPVAWHHVGERPRYTWSDPRVRWSGAQRPPVVTADEHARHRVLDWALPLTVGGRQTLVRGAVDWIGVPTMTQDQVVTWVGVGLVVMVTAGATLASWLRRRARGGDDGRVVGTVRVAGAPRVITLDDEGAARDAGPATPGVTLPTPRPPTPLDGIGYGYGQRRSRPER